MSGLVFIKERNWWILLTQESLSVFILETINKRLLEAVRIEINCSMTLSECELPSS